MSYQCSLSFWNSILNYPNELWVATEAYYVLHIRAQQHTCIIMYKLYKYKGFNVHISGYIYREIERERRGRSYRRGLFAPVVLVRYIYIYIYIYRARLAVRSSGQLFAGQMVQ